MNNVSIVVHIGRLLTALMRQTTKPAQIIFVDSGSTDATIAIASQFPIEIHSIPLEDFSFGCSGSIGCRPATADLIGIVSTHVHPAYDTWLQELTVLFGDAAVALTYGRQERGDRNKYSERQIMARHWSYACGGRRSDGTVVNGIVRADQRSFHCGFTK